MRWWNGLWFGDGGRFEGPYGPKRLAMVRAVVAAGLLAVYLRRGLWGWGGVDEAFWFPVRVLGLAPLPRLTAGLSDGLAWLFLAALAALAVGWFSRVAAAVACAAGFYVLGLPQHFGKVHHMDGLVVVVLGVLACSRCGDAWSVDAWRARRVDRVRNAVDVGAYHWPVRLLQALLVGVFFAAGVAKLRQGGVPWVTSDQFALGLVKSVQDAPWVGERGAVTDWGLWIARQPLLPNALALGGLAVELCYPVAWFSRRSRWVLVPAVVGLLVGIRLLMGPLFLTFLLLHVVWVPVHARSQR